MPPTQSQSPSNSRSGSPSAASNRAARTRTRATRSTKGSPGSAAPATSAGSQGGSGRKGKFNAGGEFVGGVWQASEAQAERYRQLLAMQEEGRIGSLRTEVTFDLTVNNRLICKYRADFVYLVLDERGRPTREVIEDVKGFATPEFKLKHKLFDALQPTPLSLIEVKGKARHSTNPKLSDKTGNPVGSNAGWLDLHWKGRIPI